MTVFSYSRAPLIVPFAGSGRQFNLRCLTVSFTQSFFDFLHKSWGVTKALGSVDDPGDGSTGPLSPPLGQGLGKPGQGVPHDERTPWTPPVRGNGSTLGAQMVRQGRRVGDTPEIPNHLGWYAGQMDIHARMGRAD